MNLASLDARNIEARRRLATAAASLAEALGLPPLVEVTPVEKRQPAVAQMRELECLADLLDGVTQALGTEEYLSHANPRPKSPWPSSAC